MYHGLREKIATTYPSVAIPLFVPRIAETGGKSVKGCTGGANLAVANGGAV